jgi:hypothetical protein
VVVLEPSDVEDAALATAAFPIAIEFVPTELAFTPNAMDESPLAFADLPKALASVADVPVVAPYPTATEFDPLAAAL